MTTKADSTKKGKQANKNKHKFLYPTPVSLPCQLYLPIVNKAEARDFLPTNVVGLKYVSVCNVYFCEQAYKYHWTLVRVHTKNKQDQDKKLNINWILI